MISHNDAVVTIVTAVFSFLQLGYVLFYPINILLATVLPGLLLPIAYVVDRRRRSGPVGLQRGEKQLLAVAVGSVLLWVQVAVLPITLFLFLAAGLSCLAIVLTVRAWQRVARTP